MKILVFNWKDIKHPYAGGAEVNIHEQAKRWIKKDHFVTQFSPMFKDAKKSEIVDGIEIIRKGGRYSVYLWAVLYYFFKLRKDAEVVIDIENGIPFFTPLFSRKPKLAIMHHVHDGVFFKELPYLVAWIPYLLERYGIRIFYKNVKFIAVSETTKEEMIDKLKLKPNNIKIVYNGLNHENLKSKIIKNKNPTIIYFGRLMKYKRIDLLMDIFSEVLKEIPESKLYIAGTGVIEEELKEKTKNMKLEDKIIFCGYVSEENKKDLLKSSWIFVNPSSMEGWGVTVIEANALGLPALAFNVPGLKEAIKNNETGFLVENEKEMKEKIIRLLNDKKLREELGKNAIKWSKNFSWDKTAEKTMNILKSLK